MDKRILFILLCFPVALFAQNQEVATYVNYNLLNYRNETSYCTNSNNSPLAKEGYLKTIFSYIQPDLIACNEVGANPSNALKILDRTLNVDGETKFKMASFSSTSGSSLANAFFYNGEMFTLKKSDKITEGVGGSYIVRLIDVFELYYNDANLPLGSDTTFLTVFVGHLKAGTGSSNETQRANTTAAVTNYLETKNIAGNYIISGDFNVYSASEKAFQNLVSPDNPEVKFIDPVNRMGSWNNNAAYADVHTQSTHSTSNSCASGGGLDDRFDFVLISDAIKTDADHIKYVRNSYKAVANDAKHFNKAINNPANTSVPADVLKAIYDNSDHLPVVMDMIITESQPNGISNVSLPSVDVKLVNPSKGVLKGVINGAIDDYAIKVYSITGSLLLSTTFTNDVKKEFSYPINEQGVIVVEITNLSGFKAVYKVVQN